LLQQGISGVTNGGTYRLTFLGGSKSGQGAAYGYVSLYDGLAGYYNSASFDYRPTDAVFGSYTVDFTARGSTDLWLRSDAGTYMAYDNVSVTQIGSVANALSYSAAGGFTEITSALSGSGKVTANAGTGGLTLKGANTYSGGTEVTGGTLFVIGSGTLGDASGAVTVNGSGSGSTYVTLDLRSQQTRTGAISMTNQDARIISGNGLGSIVNNGGAFQFGGGSLEVAVSGSGGMNITGGGRMTASNSYTGATVISATAGWYGTGQFFTESAHALGAASGDLTVSGGTLNLFSNTITRSGNLTISGGTVANGTLSNSGTAYDIQGGSIAAVLAGTAGLTKSGAGTATLSGSNTYSGATVVSTGTLQVASAGSISSSSATVNHGGVLDVEGTAGSVTVNSGGRIEGDGSVGALTIASGGILAPGNSPGTLNASSANWNAGGIYDWDLASALGNDSSFLTGQGTNWDFLNVSGILDIGAAAGGNEFIINIVDLLATYNGTFDTAANYQFAIATAAGGITNFLSSDFSFTGYLANSNQWSVGLAGNGGTSQSLILSYTGATAIPEPSTGILFLSALGVLALRRRSKA